MTPPIQFLSLNPLLFLVTFAYVNLRGILISWEKREFSTGMFFVVNKLIREQNWKKIKSFRNHIPKLCYFIIYGIKSRVAI